jgi:acetyl esterase/lipase
VPERNQHRILLNVPGGGFSTGIRANGLFFSIPAASIGQVKVVTALYRQGPEARFPAATEDFMKVYKWALKDHNPKAIGMFGCSAGGALVAQTIAAALLSDMPVPGAAGIYCAGAGARFDGDSNNFSQLLRNGGSTNTTNIIASRPGQYFDGIDGMQPAASPINDLTLLAKFPPTIFGTGTRDFAMSQAAFAHRQLLKLGVETDLLIYDGLGHGFMTYVDIPEARDFHEITARFFDKHLQ